MRKTIVITTINCIKETNNDVVFFFSCTQTTQFHYLETKKKWEKDSLLTWKSFLNDGETSIFYTKAFEKEKNGELFSFFFFF